MNRHRSPRSGTERGGFRRPRSGAPRWLRWAAAAVAAAGCGPPPDPPAELVRQGNAAPDPAVADALYAAAAERASDPGLVAFNRAVVAVRRDDFAAAEAGFRRALADAAVPPGRRARALYNRGVCLLKQGGDAATLWDAVGCFRACLGVPPADPGLAADAAHNLEVAKLLWDRERAKKRPAPEAADEPPNAPDPPGGPPDETGDPAPGGDEPGPDRGNGSPGGGDPDPTAKPTSTTAKPPPGAGSSPVRENPDRPTPRTPDQARAFLRGVADRLEADRRADDLRRAGPERPDVRDW